MAWESNHRFKEQTKKMAKTCFTSGGHSVYIPRELEEDKNNMKRRRESERS